MWNNSPQEQNPMAKPGIEPEISWSVGKDITTEPSSCNTLIHWGEVPLWNNDTEYYIPREVNSMYIELSPDISYDIIRDWSLVTNVN